MSIGKVETFCYSEICRYELVSGSSTNCSKLAVAVLYVQAYMEIIPCAAASSLGSRASMLICRQACKGYFRMLSNVLLIITLCSQVSGTVKFTLKLPGAKLFIMDLKGPIFDMLIDDMLPFQKEMDAVSVTVKKIWTECIGHSDKLLSAVCCSCHCKR